LGQYKVQTLGAHSILLEGLMWVDLVINAVFEITILGLTFLGPFSDAFFLWRKKKNLNILAVCLWYPALVTVAL
jgi:hypothetical protein